MEKRHLYPFKQAYYTAEYVGHPEGHMQLAIFFQNFS
jgi:hypothetical protein